jgi:hypothetical protein
MLDATEDIMSNANIKLVQDVYAAFGKGDIPGVFDLMTADVTSASSAARRTRRSSACTTARPAPRSSSGSSTPPTHQPIRAATLSRRRGQGLHLGRLHLDHA